GSGKDHGFVNIAFGGGAVTEAGYGNATFFCPASVGPSALMLSDPKSVADSVGDLGGKQNGVGQHVVAAGLPTSLDCTAEEIKNIFIGDAAAACHDMFAIRREDPVAVFQCSDGPGLCGFLAQ